MPHTLLQGAGLLDRAAARSLPVVPTNGLPSHLSSLVHEAVLGSDRAIVRARGAAIQERAYLLRVVSAGDGLGNGVRGVGGDAWSFTKSGWQGLQWLRSAVDLPTQPGAQRLRRILTGANRQGRYGLRTTQRLTKWALRTAERRLPYRIVGDRAARWAANIRPDAVRDAWAAKAIRTYRSTGSLRQAVSGVGKLKLIGGPLNAVGVVTDAASAVNHFSKLNSTSGATRRDHVIDGSAHTAGAIAGTVLVVAMFTPVGPVVVAGAAVVAVTAVAVQNREKIAEGARNLAKSAKGIGRSFATVFS